MKLERITTNEANSFMNAFVSNCYKGRTNLKTVHEYTGADINTAALALVHGSFTYNQLKAEGFGGNLFILSAIPRGSGSNIWTHSAAWLYVSDRVELLPCQFPENAFRKSDTEEHRKNPKGLAVVIASPSIRFRDYREVTSKPQEPKAPTLAERLREYKRNRSAEDLKNYKGTAQDIANAERVRESLYKLIRENMNKKQGADFLAYCVEVGRCDTAFRWIDRRIETLKEFEAKGSGVVSLNSWEMLETMEQYNRIIKEIDREALDICRRANA